MEEIMIDLQYEERADGLLYPILNMGLDGINNLGKFGKSRLNYIHETKIEMYQLMLLKGSFVRYLEKLDEQCYEQSEKLQQQYLAKYDLASMDFMEVVQVRTQARDIADEIILSQILE